MERINPHDPAWTSADVVAANIDRLRPLFPEAFADGTLDFEALRGLLGAAVDGADERYGLSWHGKRRARRIARTPSTGTLRPRPGESVDWDATKNLMIEGDNLEVLKLLQKSYAGTVKLIYIDPPYNTGGEFVYRDDFRDNLENYLELTGQVDGAGRRLGTRTEASGRFHTDWLNMIDPRIRLAHALLREDGLLFASIDDHEVENLRRVCNEAFGEENFVGQVCVISNPRGRQSEAVATTHEYLVIYARNRSACTIGGEALGERQVAAYKHATPEGRKYRLRGLRHRGNASLRTDRPKMFFPIYVNPTTRRVSLERGRDFPVEVLPRKPDGRDGRWEWGPETAAARIDRLEAVLVEGRGEWDVYQRDYLADDAGRTRALKWKSVWDEREINYQNGRAELKTLFGAEGPFEYPKPVYLIRKIVEGTTSDDDLIVDFFAGSGTTAQAVFEANRRDGGRRAFLLVQLPEPTGRDDYATIAEIAKERLRRCGDAIRADDPGLAPALDLGFRVFALDSSNLRAWDADRGDLAGSLLDAVDPLKAGRDDRDVVFELLLKLGLELTAPIERRTVAGKDVQCVGGGLLFVCLARGIGRDDVDPLGRGIVAWRAELAPAGEPRVVFRDGAFDDVAKTNLAAFLRQHGLENVRSL